MAELIYAAWMLIQLGFLICGMVLAICVGIGACLAMVYLSACATCYLLGFGWGYVRQKLKWIFFP